MKTAIKRFIRILFTCAFIGAVYYFGALITVAPFYISDYIDFSFFSVSENNSNDSIQYSVSVIPYSQITTMNSTGFFNGSGDNADQSVSDNSETAEQNVLSLKELYVCFNRIPLPADYVTDYSETLTYSYETEPVITGIGDYTVTICASDNEGNSTTGTTTLHILPVIPELTINVGDEIPLAEDYLLNPELEATYSAGYDNLESNLVGSFELTLTADGIPVTVTLNIIDTTAPNASSVYFTGCLGKEYSPEKLIGNCTEYSDYSVFFVEEPDWNLEGEQPVTLYIEDSYGNCSKVYSTLNLIVDDVPPIITASGTTVTVGSTISYRSLVSVNDNVDTSDEITVNIDTSSVNLSEEGTYPVVITATDLSNNTSEKTIDIKVTTATVTTPVYTQAEVDALAQSILDTIVDDSMTDSEKVYAVYHWARYNISYVSDFTIDNYLSGAYRAMSNKKSNCFGYACTIKAMLDLLGIDNVILCVPSRPHYWNIVNIGNGYYHVDATPRIDGTLIYMWDDATIKAYSDANGGTHAYDRTQYPAVN